MSQERSSFRRRLFGGFDRTDVINYIENIAGQRNKYQSEAQKFASEADELRSKLDSLNTQIIEKDIKISDTAKELDDVWKELRASLDELETVKGQLERSTKELAAKSAQYEKDLTAAQSALNDAISKCEEQRVATINTASQIVSDLRAKYEDTKVGVDSAFRDAEAKLANLLANKEN